MLLQIQQNQVWPKICTANRLDITIFEKIAILVKSYANSPEYTIMSPV